MKEFCDDYHQEDGVELSLQISVDKWISVVVKVWFRLVVGKDQKDESLLWLRFGEELLVSCVDLESLHQFLLCPLMGFGTCANIQYVIVMVRWLALWPGFLRPFWEEFACSLCAWVGSHLSTWGFWSSSELGVWSGCPLCNRWWSSLTFDSKSVWNHST